jgi:hypothetical protein
MNCPKLYKKCSVNCNEKCVNNCHNTKSTNLCKKQIKYYHTYKYKILSITRHGVRGVKFLNSQIIKISENLILPNPFISYNLELNKNDINLINIKPINTCVQKGVNNLNLGNWNMSWNEIRCDFLFSRCYETGNYLYKQIKSENKDNNVKLTAYINKSQPNINYVYDSSNYDPLVYTIPENNTSNNINIYPSLINENVFKRKTYRFLNYLNISLNNKKYTDTLPPVFTVNNGDQQINTFYSLIVYNAINVIISLSYKYPALNILFKTTKKYPYQKELLMSALNWHKYYLENYYSQIFMVYSGYTIIDYLNNFLNYDNIGNMILTHDTRQYHLFKALEIETPFFNLPFQSFIIVKSKENISITYCCPTLYDNGTYYTPMQQKTIWKGTSYEWNSKIQKIVSQIKQNGILPYKINKSSELLQY